jgi:hypothetical protein
VECFITLVYSGVRVAQTLVCCAVFCRSLFGLFLLAIVLSGLLRLTAYDYPFDLIKLFLLYYFFLNDNIDFRDSADVIE